MRLNPLYLLPFSLTVLAQNQAPLDSNTPTSLNLRQQAEKYIGVGKKLANVYLGSTPVDYETRHKSDREAGVVRLTDENWDKEMRAWDGDWVIVLHGGLYGGPTVPDPASTYFLEMHTNATSLASQYIASPPLETDREEKLANLKRIKWARFDYMTEWETCARWMITRPPWLIFVSNKGEDVRFLGTRSLSPEGKKLFSFMAYKNWESLNIWKPAPFFSRCAEMYIAAHKKVGGMTGDIPKWVWLFVIPAATQGLVKYLFFGGGGGGAPAPAAAEAAGARTVPVAKKNA